MCKNDCIQACCQPARVTASDCVHNYVTKTSDSRMWTHSVCFAGIPCRTKTGACFFSSFLCIAHFIINNVFFHGKSFRCRVNLCFRGQFPCLPIVRPPQNQTEMVLKKRWSLVRFSGMDTGTSYTGTPWHGNTGKPWHKYRDSWHGNTGKPWHINTGNPWHGNKRGRALKKSLS